MPTTHRIREKGKQSSYHAHICNTQDEFEEGRKYIMSQKSIHLFISTISIYLYTLLTYGSCIVSILHVSCNVIWAYNIRRHTDYTRQHASFLRLFDPSRSNLDMIRGKGKEKYVFFCVPILWLSLCFNIRFVSWSNMTREQVWLLLLHLLFIFVCCLPILSLSLPSPRTIYGTLICLPNSQKTDFHKLNFVGNKVFTLPGTKLHEQIKYFRNSLSISFLCLVLVYKLL